MMEAPTSGDVLAAAQRIQGRVVRTPLLRSPALDDAAGRPVLLKAETMQRTGSFKYRGASNFVMRLASEESARGVVAYSSGNHAQGVAAAAALAGIPATIVMPRDAPQVKLDRTRSWGAEVVVHERSEVVREEIARKIADDSGATLVPPYEHPWTIAGQGSTGVEVAGQASRLGVVPERIIVPCGGGGLTAGIALALSELLPTVTIHTAEPEGFDDHARSLRAGERLDNPPDASSICDALLAPRPGEITFSVNSRLVESGLVVSDRQVRSAMAFAFNELKLVVEPGGAAALAALLGGGAPGAGPCVVVLSGGNVDPATLSDALVAAG